MTNHIPIVNSYIPALKEAERFISFLDKRFKLNLPNNYLITINKATKNTLGFFMSAEHKNKFVNSNKDLNNINLNTFYLKSNNPYEILTHELSHYVNFINKIKDCSSNQYHNKHFKTQAEKFKLKVEKNKRGYAKTSTTEEFNLMLKEFKPNKESFNIIQNHEDKKKVGSRLRLYICDCKVKVRVGSDDFKALCLDCNTEFKKIEK